MSDFTWTQWIPGISVLVGCLVVGLVAAFRLSWSGASESDAQARDLELKIADLETRRDELYARLRGDAARDVDVGEIDALERAAACTLRDLDRAHAALDKVHPGKKRSRSKDAAKPAKAGEPSKAAPAAPRRGFLASHPLLVGFLSGAAMVTLVVALIFWAQGDARPGARGAPSPPQQAAAGGEMPPDHPPAGEGSADPAIASLEARLQSNPDDFATRKQLALSYLDNRMLFQAFQEAQNILATVPQDPDGLYISAVVRLAMGDSQSAASLLDQVLAQFPEHVLAWVYRGLALQQLGDFDGAVASWERGLAAAGGRHPELEQMIAQLKAAPHGPGGPDAAPPATASVPAPPAASSGPRTYRIQVELPPGAEVTPGSALFVSLHDGSGGPPAASKRVAGPSFPVEVTLDSSDSMMGMELPAVAMIQVRLDCDGDPSTEGEGDLWARGESRSGQLMTFVLW